VQDYAGQAEQHKTPPVATRHGHELAGDGCEPQQECTRDDEAPADDDERRFVDRKHATDGRRGAPEHGRQQQFEANRHSGASARGVGAARARATLSSYLPDHIPPLFPARAGYPAKMVTSPALLSEIDWGTR